MILELYDFLSDLNAYQAGIGTFSVPCAPYICINILKNSKNVKPYLTHGQIFSILFRILS